METRHAAAGNSSPHRRWPPQPYVEDAPDSGDERNRPSDRPPCQNNAPSERRPPTENMPPSQSSAPSSGSSKTPRTWPPQPYVEDAPDSGDERQPPSESQPRPARAWPPKPSVEDVADYEEPSHERQRPCGLWDSIHNPDRPLPR